MKIIKTNIPDLLIIEPKVFEDKRGYFFESYNSDRLAKEGLNYNFVQDNQSKSSYGVIRGLHYQLAPHEQTKLIRVLDGKILDVVVDIRKGSPTFGKSYSIELSADNKKQFLVPRGFAHGFVVLSEVATILYKCDNLYHPAADCGIIYNDPTLDIDWQINKNDIIVSEKDAELNKFKDADMNFIYSNN